MSPVWGEVPKWIIPEVKIDLGILDKKREWEELGMIKYQVNIYRKDFMQVCKYILMDLKIQEQGLQV